MTEDQKITLMTAASQLTQDHRFDLAMRVLCVIRQLDSQLAPSQLAEVDWEVIGRAAHLGYYVGVDVKPVPTIYLSETVKKAWEKCARFVVEAYEAAKKGGASGENSNPD